jgi:Mycobacterium membrane protein
MTDSRHRPGSGFGEPDPYSNTGYTDPAYAEQSPYGTPYSSSGTPNPTQQLPAYSQYGYGYNPYATGTNNYPYPPAGTPVEPPPPRGPSRRWLWILATASVLTVLGLVIAMVIVNVSDQQTVVAPPPLEPTFTTPSSPPTTTRTPTPSRAPGPTRTLPRLPFPPPGNTKPSAPDEPTVPGEMETVVYRVDGTGRAISITYVDAGGVLQTEFNAMLPWSKEVELDKPAKTSASVNIINFGRELTCSITVAGNVVEHHTGSGLTICGALG